MKERTTVRIVPKTNRESVERIKIDALAHKYMTAPFPGLVHALQESKPFGLHPFPATHFEIKAGYYIYYIKHFQQITMN